MEGSTNRPINQLINANHASPRIEKASYNDCQFAFFWALHMEFAASCFFTAITDWCVDVWVRGHFMLASWELLSTADSLCTTMFCQMSGLSVGTFLMGTYSMGTFSMGTFSMGTFLMGTFWWELSDGNFLVGIFSSPHDPPSARRSRSFETEKEFPPIFGNDCDALTLVHIYTVICFITQFAINVVSKWGS